MLLCVIVSDVLKHTSHRYTTQCHSILLTFVIFSTILNINPGSPGLDSHFSYRIDGSHKLSGVKVVIMVQLNRCEHPAYLVLRLVNELLSKIML